MLVMCDLTSFIVMSLLPVDLHVCCLAWLGHSHVTLPGYSSLVLKLPHCQVQTFLLWGQLTTEESLVP